MKIKHKLSFSQLRLLRKILEQIESVEDRVVIIQAAEWSRATGIKKTDAFEDLWAQAKKMTELCLMYEGSSLYANVIKRLEHNYPDDSISVRVEPSVAHKKEQLSKMIEVTLRSPNA